jgi:hypothetical protein
MGGRVIDEIDGEAELEHDARDYDRDYYAALLRRTFATRLARAFHPADFTRLFADPEQLPLFDAQLDTIVPVATRVEESWRALR